MLDGKIRYLRSIFLQNILFVLVNISLSFPKFIKIIVHGLFHSRKSLEFTPVYPSLQTESISSYYTYDLDQDHWYETHDTKKQPCEPHNTEVEVAFFPHNSVSSNTQNWFKPLHLPHILHDFPIKHYKYLPRFDKESKDLTTNKTSTLLRIFP